MSFGLGTLLLACGGSGEGGAKGGHGAKAGHGGAKRGGAKKEKAPLAVTLASVAAADLVISYEASGTLEATRSAQIRASQSGVLRSVEVEEGDQVKADQVLARLDARELSLIAKRDRVAADNAAKELSRLDELVARQAASSQEVDQQRYALQSARASAKLSRHQAGLNTVRAPFDGTVTARLLDVGNLVGPSDVIYEIADLERLELALHLPEREAGRVNMGARVRMTNLANESFEGEIVRRAPIVDALTGTIKFTVRSQGERPSTAVPGAFVRAAIELESHLQVASVPKKAIMQIDEANYVFVIDQGKAKRVPVELGVKDAERVQILSGLELGAKIVAEAHEISDGMPLKGFGEEAPASAKADTHKKERKGKREAG